MVQCKFRVSQITQNEYSPEAKQIRMTAVNSEPFGQYTPAGSIDMQILNPEAAKQFELGKEYIVEFKSAE